MGEVTNEQVNLMLRLFEDRREPRLREAREWFSANFHMKNEEELMRVCPPGSQGNTYMRMVPTESAWPPNPCPRPHRRRVFFRKQRGAMGRVGTGEAGDRRVARDV